MLFTPYSLIQLIPQMNRIITIIYKSLHAYYASA